MAALGSPVASAFPLRPLPSKASEFYAEWRVGDRTVTIFNQKNRVTYRVVNQESVGRSVVEKQGSIPIPEYPEELPIETKVATFWHHLLEGFPVLQNGKLKIYVVSQNWHVENLLARSQTVSLLWFERLPLIWNLFSHSTKKHEIVHIQVPVNARSTRPSHRCSQEACEALEEFIRTSDRCSEEACAELFRDFEINEANETRGIIELQPRKMPSRIDPEVYLTHFQWAVTVISTGTLVGGLGRNHAQLIIEGMEGGERFTTAYDFGGGSALPLVERTTPGNVLPYDLTQKEIRFVAHSKVWKIPRKEMEEKLIKPIKAEIDNPSLCPPLNVLGRSSIFARSGEENCFDWVKDKLKNVGIVFEATIVGKTISLVLTPTRYYLASESKREETEPSYWSPPSQDQL